MVHVVEERTGMPGHQHFPYIVERSTELPLTVGVVMFVIVESFFNVLIPFLFNAFVSLLQP